MPIYEFACPKCRRIFSFLSKRVNPGRLPVCPKCGGKKMSRQISRFAMTKGLKEPAAKDEMAGEGPPLPDFDDPRVERAMMEMERDMEHLDENNPRHMAHMMKKMKDLMPPVQCRKNSTQPSNVSKPAKTRKRLKLTWATYWAISWAARKVAAAAAGTRKTAVCMIIELRSGSSAERRTFFYALRRSAETPLRKYASPPRKN